MAGGTRIRESRSSHRVAPGGRNRKPNIKVLTFFLLTICCTAGAAGGVHLSRQRAAPVSQQGLTYEASMVSGNVPGRTREQRQKELDSVVEEGTLAVSMNVTLFGKTAGADCSISWIIENPSNQGKLIHMGITHDDTGEKIFEAGAIHPRDYLESGPLLTPPPAGEHGYVTVLLAYQEETEILIGQIAARIKLVL